LGFEFTILGVGLIVWGIGLSEMNVVISTTMHI